MVGAITNFKDWIFTKYDMKQEIDETRKKQKGFADEENPEMCTFEYSNKLTICWIDKDNNEIVFSKKQLEDLIEVTYNLANLNNYFIAMMA